MISVYSCFGFSSECHIFLNKTQTFFGRDISYYNPQRGSLSLDLIAPQGGVFLGITNYGHHYLVAGDRKVEGSYFPFPSLRDSSGNVHGGYLIHFPELTPSEVEKLKASLSSNFGGFSFSCVRASCHPLKKVGISRRGFLESIFSSQSLKGILQGHSFKDSEGRDVPYTIYGVTRRSDIFEDIYLDSMIRDARYATSSVILTLFLVWGSGLLLIGFF